MSAATIIYGIKNCTTVKKARAWLDARGVDYTFHDFKTAGIDRRTLEDWSRQLGWQVLLNRAGTTFRKLPQRDKEVADAKSAITLMLQQPSMIKRPVLDRNGRLTVGFKPEIYETVLRGRAK